MVNGLNLYFQVTYLYVGPEERERSGEVGRKWVLGDDAKMTSRHLSNRFIEGIETTFENWKPKERYTLEVV